MQTKFNLMLRVFNKKNCQIKVIVFCNYIGCQVVEDIQKLLLKKC